MPPPVVLLCDDNEDCRIIYGSVLRHAGYEVRLANDGLACLASAAERRPGLILLDIGMPRMDGLEALARLKRDPATTDIPVVAVSARVGKDQRGTALEAGFTEVLLKPITPAEILASVKRHLPLATTPDHALHPPGRPPGPATGEERRGPSSIGAPDRHVVRPPTSPMPGGCPY